MGFIEQFLVVLLERDPQVRSEARFLVRPIA